MLDLRYAMNARDNYWDGVYTEHTLEHLYPIDVLGVLREIHRTLKHGAWVRVIVPDLEKYIRYYCGAPSDPLFQRWPLRAEALRNISQNHFHFSLWDRPLMMEYLRIAGFSTIVPREYGEGDDCRLLKDSVNRRWESLYVEARK